MMQKAVVAACLVAGCAASHKNAGLSQFLQDNENDFIAQRDVMGQFDASAFISDFAKPDDTSGSFSIAEVVDTNPLFATFPNNGMGFVMFDLQPCGVNQPHVHPRATEWAFVIEGSLEMGVVEENGGRGALVNHVPTGQAMIFPQGHMHFQINDNCERARFVSSLNHNDPGVITVQQRLLDVPDNVLRATLGSDDNSLAYFKKKVGKVPQFPTDPVCMERCGLSHH